MKNISDYRKMRTLIAAILFCVGLPAFADIYHYNNILIGDRAAGMGGAYTAVSDDPSGLYYNPAGVAHASGASINGSVNAFHYTYSEYKNVLGDKTWTRESMGLVPNFFGIIQPFAGGMVGMSVVVTDAVNEDQDQHFEDFTPSGAPAVDDYFINFNNQDTTYNIGPSFSLKLRDELTVGVTLYGHYRRQQFILNQQVYRTNGDQIWTNDYFEVEEFGVNPVFGATWSPWERLSLGLSIRKTLVLRSQAKLQSTAKSESDTTIALPTQAQSSYKRELPLHINAGIAYFVNDRLLFTGDVMWSDATESAQSITNFSAGAEYYVHSQWALRAGLFSNLATTPELNASQQSQNEHVDLYGGSLSISRFTRNSSLTLGVSGSVGSGKAQMLRGVSTQQDVGMQTLTTFLAAGNSF